MRNPNALKWSDLKTGIFFIFGIGFAAYLGLVIGKNSSLFTGVTTVKVLAGNMHGLAENNFVSVSGKKVGTVSKMEFVGSHDSLYVVADSGFARNLRGWSPKTRKPQSNLLAFWVTNMLTSPQEKELQLWMATSLPQYRRRHGRADQRRQTGSRPPQHPP